MINDLKNPTTKEILMLLGIGVFIGASFIFPGLPLAAKPFVDYQRRKRREESWKNWNRFNKPRLRSLLKRLYQQKVVEISEEDGEGIVKLTDKGKHKLLKYKLEEIMIHKPKRWDGKWRLVIYDIKKQKRFLSEVFRNFLKKMEFWKLQKSVYLTPYPCKEQIEFLRSYYGLSAEILYLEVNKIENEEVYKNYFGI